MFVFKGCTKSLTEFLNPRITGLRVPLSLTKIEGKYKPLGFSVDYNILYGHGPYKMCYGTSLNKQVYELYHSFIKLVFIYNCLTSDYKRFVVRL